MEEASWAVREGERVSAADLRFVIVRALSGLWTRRKEVDLLVLIDLLWVLGGGGGERMADAVPWA